MLHRLRRQRLTGGVVGVVQIEHHGLVCDGGQQRLRVFPAGSALQRHLHVPHPRHVHVDHHVREGGGEAHHLRLRRSEQLVDVVQGGDAGVGEGDLLRRQACPLPVAAQRFRQAVVVGIIGQPRPVKLLQGLHRRLRAAVGVYAQAAVQHPRLQRRRMVGVALGGLQQLRPNFHVHWVFRLLTSRRGWPRPRRRSVRFQIPSWPRR